MSIISMDDPEHTRQRRLINRGFTPARVRELADHMRADQPDHRRDPGRGQIDFVEDFAIHVPLIVIAEMMGLDPRAARPPLQVVRRHDGRRRPPSTRRPPAPGCRRGLRRVRRMCAELIEERRGVMPRDDLISILTNAFDEGALRPAAMADGQEILDEGMSSDELFLFLALLVVAGNETTRNALTGGLLAFSLFPEQKQR